MKKKLLKFKIDRPDAGSMTSQYCIILNKIKIKFINNKKKLIRKSYIKHI